MPKAAIIAIDDDRAVLNSVERDLRQKYGRDYRIVKAESGQAALDAVNQLKQRGESVALFVADQRMPAMNGVEFLAEAIKVFPEARKVLLTAYADTAAAIDAINKVGLDYYLMKPWDPPQDHLYPVLDGLLDDWKANARAPFEGIRVVGSLWSSASHDIKDFLGRNSIPYQFLDIETNSDARALAEKANDGAARVPTLIFPDGAVLIEPTAQQVADKCGLRTRASRPFYDAVIIGGGPAGLSASVYASSDGLKVLLIERQAPGGQAGNSPKIENYLGFPAGISGADGGPHPTVTAYAALDKAGALTLLVINRGTTAADFTLALANHAGGKATTYRLDAERVAAGTAAAAAGTVDLTNNMTLAAPPLTMTLYVLP